MLLTPQHRTDLGICCQRLMEAPTLEKALKLDALLKEIDRHDEYVASMPPQENLPPVGAGYDDPDLPPLCCGGHDGSPPITP